MKQIESICCLFIFIYFVFFTSTLNHFVYLSIYTNIICKTHTYTIHTCMSTKDGKITSVLIFRSYLYWVSLNAKTFSIKLFCKAIDKFSAKQTTPSSSSSTWERSHERKRCFWNRRCVTDLQPVHKKRYEKKNWGNILQSGLSLNRINKRC